MTQFDYTRQAKIRDLWFSKRIAPIPNNILDWSTKGVIFGVSQEFVQKNIPLTRLLKVWYPNLRDHCGMTEGTFKKGMATLTQAKAIIKSTTTEPDKTTKEKKTRTWLAFTPEFIKDPISLFAPLQKEEKRGGDRRIKRHKGCGGEVVNLCTTCGETHISEKDVYFESADSQESDISNDGRVDLAQLDALIAATDQYYEAADIDDDVVDAMGGADKALAASPAEIARIMAMPRYEREGITAEEYDLAFDEMARMKTEGKKGKKK